MLEKVQCRLLILGNHNVPCRYFLNVLVDFKVVQFRKGLGRASNLTVEGALVNHLSLNTSWYGEVAVEKASHATHRKLIKVNMLLVYVIPLTVGHR